MATVPNARTWAVGESATAAKFNTDIRDGFEFYLAPPRAILRNVATQTIATNTETAVIWDTEDLDTDGGHSNVTNNTRYTAQTAGWYWLTATIRWPDFLDLGSTIGMVEVVLRKNGLIGNRLGRSDQFPHSIENIAMVTCGHMQLNVGDYVEVLVYQETGGNMPIGPAVPGTPAEVKAPIHDPRFEIRWIRS